jgi:hypothetical protein
MQTSGVGAAYRNMLALRAYTAQRANSRKVAACKPEASFQEHEVMSEVLHCSEHCRWGGLQKHVGIARIYGTASKLPQGSRLQT